MSENRFDIKIQNASLHYGSAPVFNKITHYFAPKAVTSVIGPSGTGKSTLLRTLNRMNDRIDGFRIDGEVWVGGQNIYEENIDVYALRQSVGIVFQKPCVFPKSIYENVIFGIKRLQPEKKKEFAGLAEQALRKVSLWDEVQDRLDEPGLSLSQGQQQRLVLARTLISKPDILLMDEPTSSLDPRSARAIENLILSLKENHTIILVTHNIGQAKRVSDETIFVCNGDICEAGDAQKLLEDPCCQETRDYLNQGR
jgi:phosphate transport system ATP-binding protein